MIYAIFLDMKCICVHIMTVYNEDTENVTEALTLLLQMCAMGFDM